MHRHWAIQGGHLMLFFPLHPSILEPDFNLPLCHQQGMSNFYPPAACQVAIKMKFFLQFKSLVSGVGCMCPLFFTLLIYCVWIWNKKLNINFWKYSNFALMWLGNFPERNWLKSRIISQKTWVSQEALLTGSVFWVTILDFNPFLAGKWPCHIKAKVKSFRNWCLIFFSDSNSRF